MRLPAVATLPHSTQDLTVIINHALSNTNFILKKISELSEQLYCECTPAEKKYYDDNVRITKEEALKICTDTLGQDNDIWESVRYGKMTGSTIYGVYTYSRNQTGMPSLMVCTILPSVAMLIH